MLVLKWNVIAKWSNIVVKNNSLCQANMSLGSVLHVKL